MGIPTSVRLCLAEFERVQLKALELTIHAVHAALGDESGRFRTWAADVSAHHLEPESLEQCLRDDSKLRVTVESLLEDLRTALSRVELDMMTQKGFATPNSSSAVLNSPIQDERESLDNGNIFTVDENEDLAIDPLRHGLEELHEVITCLLRFSRTLRNPARFDRAQKDKRGLGMIEFSEDQDNEFKKGRFKNTPSFLAVRLGRNVVKNELHLGSRGKQRTQLEEVPEEVTGGERTSAVSSSLHSSSHAAEPSIADEDGSTDSDSSGIRTPAGISTSKGAFPVPRRPAAGQNGQPFECPICRAVIVVNSERSWEQHIFDDMPPFVCIYRNCSRGDQDQPFARRWDWLQHLSTHRLQLVWHCPFSCEGTFTTSLGFSQHLRENHEQVLEPSVLKRLIDSCSHANIVRSARCRMCNFLCEGTEELHHHCGDHMEQLVFSSLARHFAEGHETSPSLTNPS